jgi:hypothetical protein
VGLLHSLSSPSTPQLNSPRDPRGTLFSIDAPAGRQDKGSPYSVTVSIVWTNDAQVRPNSYHTNQQLGPETTRSSQPIHTNHQPPPRELQSFCSLLTLSLHFPPVLCREYARARFFEHLFGADDCSFQLGCQLHACACASLFGTPSSHFSLPFHYYARMSSYLPSYLQWPQGIAAVLSSVLYFKQKCVAPPQSIVFLNPHAHS